MSNVYKKLLGLLPGRPLLIGDVTDVTNGVATITLIDGGTAQARGSASVGDRVFFRDGAIEGTAPNLPIETIDL